MEKLKSILTQKFGDKYEFILPSDVVYNLKENRCTMSFLYPSDKNLLETEKIEIVNYLTDVLKLNAKLVVKFHKSFVEEDLIIHASLNFFKTKQRSLASVVKSEDIHVKINIFDTELTIFLPEKILEIVNLEQIELNLIQHLKKQFLTNFTIKFDKGKALDEEKIESNITQNLEKKIKLIKPTNRYRVFEPVVIVGREITPEPEFISNINTTKDSVILAGRIENFTKKSYKRKNKNNEEFEKFFYKFTLREENRFINMVHFSTKANVAKMDKLADGDSILVIADIKKENGYLNGYIRHLSLCEIDENIRKSCKEKITTYRTVRPQKYEKEVSATLLDLNPKFTDFVFQNTFVVFDVETTGLDSDKCEITEIGAVKLVNGKITEKFQTLVKPKGVISRQITELTGITNEMVATAPKPEHVIKDFWLFAQGCILSGYNVGFDMRFIQHLAIENGLKFDNEIYDVLDLTRAKVRAKNYKLGTIVETLRLTLENAHRAFFDALATAEVFLELSKVKDIEDESIKK